MNKKIDGKNNTKQMNRTITFEDTYGILKLSSEEDPQILKEQEWGYCRSTQEPSQNQILSNPIDKTYLFDLLWKDPFDSLSEHNRDLVEA